MPISSDEVKLKLVAYDENSNIDDSVITRGLNFDITGNYFLFVNKPIPKYSKVYIEVEVIDCDMSNDIRHIPLMVGISKEPSKGYLNTDYCIGSVYYTKNTWAPDINPSAYLAYKMIEKAGYANPIITFNANVNTRPPIQHSTIGIGIDMKNNTINIYSDGLFLYGFTPDYFHLNDRDNVYISLYSLEVNKHIKGLVRFGNDTFKYTPVIYVDGNATTETYNGLYDELFLRAECHLDLESRIKIGYRYTNLGYDKNLFEGKLNIDNDLAPINNIEHRRDLDIITNKDSMRYYKDVYKTILNKHAFQYNPRETNIDYAYISFPFDKFEKLYFEMSCYNAQLDEAYLGIPLYIGLTKDPTFLERESFMFSLYHSKSDADSILKNAIFRDENITEYDYSTLHIDASYISTYYKEGFRWITNTNYNIINPVYPSQPTTLGILVDLHNNTLEIYTEGVLFTTITIDKDIIDFSLPEEPVYFFFKAAPAYVFIRSGYVICNFETKNTEDRSYRDKDFMYFTFSGDENIKGLWDYYNFIMREIYYDGVERNSDIIATIKVIEERLLYGKNIFCRIIVPESDPNALKWSPGLNKLWKTYNDISNTEEPNNVPDKSIFDLQKMIKEDEDNNRR